MRGCPEAEGFTTKMVHFSPRNSPRALRRRRMRRLVFAAVAALVVLWSFGAGYLWRKFRTKEPAPGEVPAVATAEQRAEAVRLLDEGVRARFEERWQGVLNVIPAARRADPKVRGIDILIGEIALEQKDPETLRRATERSLKTGENEAAAKLLRAVETWMKRGELGVDQAGALAGQYLSEAAESEPSNAAVRFFHGELSRLLGDGKGAHSHLRGALYRQTPWHSSALLKVKMQMAAREASDAGRPVVVEAPNAQAEVALALLDTVRRGGSTASARANFFVITPALQSCELLEEATLAEARYEGEALRLRAQAEAGIPFLRTRADAVH